MLPTDTQTHTHTHTHTHIYIYIYIYITTNIFVYGDLVVGRESSYCGNKCVHGIKNVLKL